MMLCARQQAISWDGEYVNPYPHIDGGAMVISLSP